MNFKIVGVILLVAAVLILATINYLNHEKRQVPLVFSPKTLLAATWSSYKEELLEPETFRTLDKQRDNITTSEGQSYTMLRAVWMDDKEIFDRSWQWTKDNLQREDKLFSWLFGERPDKSYGILNEQGGANSASDADTDIALALIFANERWADQKYLDEALPIIKSIWANEVVVIRGRPYLAANNLEKNGTGDVLINPSYLAPYAYKIFADFDPQNNWIALADSSYEIINTSLNEPLGHSSSAKIPPDWIMIERSTGRIKPPSQETLTSNFSYDALRVPFRLALDWKWFQDPRAKAALNNMGFLSREWNSRQTIYSGYSHDGQAVSVHENPSMYGGSIGYFMVADPENASEVFDKKLKTLYNNDNFDWKETLSYYDDNWAWFGIALYYEELTNLYRKGQNDSAT